MLHILSDYAIRKLDDFLGRMQRCLCSTTLIHMSRDAPRKAVWVSTRHIVRIEGAPPSRVLSNLRQDISDLCGETLDGVSQDGLLSEMVQHGLEPLLRHLL